VCVCLYLIHIKITKSNILFLILNPLSSENVCMYGRKGIFKKKRFWLIINYIFYHFILFYFIFIYFCLFFLFFLIFFFHLRIYTWRFLSQNPTLNPHTFFQTRFFFYFFFFFYLLYSTFLS
jgi:hypothetical protein